MSETSWARVVGKAVDIEENKPEADIRTKPVHTSTEPELPSDPKAQRRQRLLLEALKSRVNAITGERWCLGCGRVFSDISKLAQHIADKHGGINGITALDEKNQQRSNEAPKLGDVAVVRSAVAASEKQKVPRLGTVTANQQQQPQEKERPATSLKLPKQEPLRKPPAASAFQAPEGTHAKKKKRPSKLKRGYTKAKAQQAVTHWQGALKAIEHALEVYTSLEESIQNELVSGELTANENLPGVWAVQLQVLHKRLELAQLQRQELQSACASARERLKGAKAVLNPQPPALHDGPRNIVEAPKIRGPTDNPSIQELERSLLDNSVPQPQPLHAATDDTMRSLAPVRQASALVDSTNDKRSSSSDDDFDDDESDTSDLGGFINVLGQWAEQSGASRVSYPKHQNIEEQEEQVVMQDPAVPGYADNEEEESSSDTSSEGSFGLQWGDTLRVWAQGVGAEAHVSLLIGRAASSGGADDSREEPRSLKRVETHTEAAPPLYEIATSVITPTDDTVGELPGSIDKDDIVKQSPVQGDATEAEVADAQGVANLKTREGDALPRTIVPPTMDPVTSWVQNISDFVPQSMSGAAEVASNPSLSTPAQVHFPNKPHPLQFHCHLCGVTATGQRPWNEHLASKRHSQRVKTAAEGEIHQTVRGVDSSKSMTCPPEVSNFPIAAAAAAAAALSIQPPVPPRRYVGADADVASYVDHIITPEINNAVEALLRQLLEWQERTRRLDPVNARRKRRLVSGLREVEKAVRGRKAKVLIVAPNIEALEVVESNVSRNGVEEKEESAAFPVEPLLVTAREHGTPLVFALSRQRMGKLMGQRKRASAFAVLDASGAETQLRAVVELVARSRDSTAPAALHC